MEEQHNSQVEGQSNTGDGDIDGLLDDVILELDDYKGTKSFGGPQSVTEGMTADDEPAEEESKPQKPKDEKPQNPDEEDEEDESDDSRIKRREGESRKQYQQRSILETRKEIEALKKQIRDLQSNKGQPQEDKPKEPDTVLTDQQLLAIMQEHEGEPEVLLNIMKYIQQQGAKDAAKTAEATQKVASMSKQADAYLSTVFNGYGTEEFTGELDQHFPLEDWGLKNNPLGRQIQAGLALASAFKAVLAKELEKTGKSAQKTQVEEKRKEAIVQRGGLPKSQPSKTSGNLEGRSAQVAKELGLNPAARELYAKFLGSGRRA